MKNSKINQKIIDLWAKYFKSEDNVKTPVFYDDAKQGVILFIGMNPSYNEKAIHKHIKNSIVFNGKSIERIFGYCGFLEYEDKNEFVDFIIELEKGWIENLYPYFRPMIKIAEDNNSDFQHIDLFPYKQTSQKEFEKLVIKNETKEKIEFTDFGLDSLKIFKELIHKYSPKVIIVANAKASTIFKQLYVDDLEWNEEKGYHLFKDNTPIFFSSMLSGQRTLDRHSFERLRWHIRKIFKDKTNR